LTLHEIPPNEDEFHAQRVHEIDEEIDHLKQDPGAGNLPVITGHDSAPVMVHLERFPGMFSSDA
jgi:hypothetical protein